MKVALVAAVVALVVTSGAAAMRGPTGSEAKAIRFAATGFIAMPHSPAAKDNKVASIRVSTLDRRYAAVRLTSGTAGPSDLVLHQSFDTWFVLAFGSSVGCDAAPAAVLADLKVGCSPPGSTAWISNCGPLVSKPATLVLACADGNYSLTKLAWRGWGKATAAATGTAVANECTPNCAAGHFHAYPALVTASRLKTCGRAHYYARLTIAYPGKRPPGIGKRSVQTLTC